MQAAYSRLLLLPINEVFLYTDQLALQCGEYTAELFQGAARCQSHATIEEGRKAYDAYSLIRRMQGFGPVPVPLAVKCYSFPAYSWWRYSSTSFDFSGAVYFIPANFGK